MGIEIFSCDVCNSDDAAEIECLSMYTGGLKIHVCRDCGFIYVRERRSFEEIAASWANEIYGTAEFPRDENVYTAVLPAIQGRLVFILQTLNQQIGVSGKSLCDIGAGEGVFLTYVKKTIEDVDLFGIEPSTVNCRQMERENISCFDGTIEQYLESEHPRLSSFDIVTIMWTLEDCQNCRTMLHAANQLLKPGGHLIVGTGSRILVPFKKPLHHYIGKGHQDTHCFRFTETSLSNLFGLTGFDPVYQNRYIDNDVLCLIGEKREKIDETEIKKEDYRKIIDFFERWHQDTQAYYANA